MLSKQLGYPFRYLAVMLICGITVLTISLLDIAGWITGNDLLTNFGKGNIQMSPTTAILFFMIGAAYLLIIADRKSQSLRVVAITTAVIVIGFCLPLFIMGVFKMEAPFPKPGFGIQNQFSSPVMGHMSPGTSLLFTLTGVVVLLLMLGQPGFLTSLLPPMLSGLILLMSIVFLSGYITGKPWSYGPGHIPMALNTSIAFAAVGLALTAESALWKISHETAEEFRNSRSLHAFAMVIAVIITGILFFGYFNMLTSFNNIKDGLRNQLTLISESGARDIGNHIRLGGDPAKLDRFLAWPLVKPAGKIEVLSDTTGIVIGMNEIADSHDIRWEVCSSKVEGTSLIVVAGIQKSLAFKPMIIQFVQVSILIVSLLILTVTVLVLFGRQTRLRFYKDQIQTAEKLHMVEEQFRNAFEHSSVGKTMIYADGRYLVNKAFADMLGYTMEEMSGKAWSDITHPDDRQKNRDIMDLMIRGERESVRFEKRYLHRDGHAVWVDLQSYLQHDKDGKPDYFITSASNITDYKILQEQLIRSKEDAERSNRLKDAFIANISHEIRTPLNAIIGFTDLVRDEIEEMKIDGFETYFDIIHNSGNRLTRTVDMILNLSRIEVGEYEPHMTDFKIDSVIRNLIAEYELIAQKKGVQLTYVNSWGGSVIRGDDYCLTHSISNLIDNALKYTPSGSVRVELYSNPDNNTCLDVTDTGIGISDEFIAQLFMPFTQEDAGSTRRFEGIGLGLSIAYRLLSASGASITVRSSKGEGSTFTIVFPS